MEQQFGLSLRRGIAARELHNTSLARPAERIPRAEPSGPLTTPLTIQSRVSRSKSGEDIGATEKEARNTPSALERITQHVVDFRTLDLLERHTIGSDPVMIKIFVGTDTEPVCEIPRRALLAVSRTMQTQYYITFTYLQLRLPGAVDNNAVLRLMNWVKCNFTTQKLCYIRAFDLVKDIQLCHAARELGMETYIQPIFYAVKDTLKDIAPDYDALDALQASYPTITELLETCAHHLAFMYFWGYLKDPEGLEGYVEERKNQKLFAAMKPHVERHEEKYLRLLRGSL
ncbi:hypothetical protein P154DRAFT_599954 [Amniculicola lignicola CBS 123094]|uniref:Uncharacterized protein n=1 Tax=Amniculicola lignicola CBS 123094 TaxID=1392246 RepID=A0A6A5WHZ5_9PLEO|nr:hypothetical protein P154DRAFT_599954 [Amniculicola lignicola CBS 123094]